MSASRSRREPWLVAALGVPALLVVFTVVAILPAGWVLGHLSDLVQVLISALLDRGSK